MTGSWRSDPLKHNFTFNLGLANRLIEFAYEPTRNNSVAFRADSARLSSLKFRNLPEFKLAFKNKTGIGDDVGHFCTNIRTTYQHRCGQKSLVGKMNFEFVHVGKSQIIF